MNIRLIFLLSLFGLGMAFGTVYLIPSNIEPVFWLVIFLMCAYLIARNAPGKFFLHGFLVSIMNSVWITAAHLILFNDYIANHEREAAMMSDDSSPLSPKIMMLITGPLIGVVSGLVLGLFAYLAARLFRKRIREA